MRALIRQMAQQPFVGAATAVVAAIAVLSASLREAGTVDGGDILLAAILVVALVLSYRFPVHIGRSMKACMGSVALYLMAVLLPPVPAAFTVGAGVFAGELMMRKERDLLPFDIVSDVSRLMLAGLAASLVAHAVSPGSIAYTGVIVAGGVVLWAADIVTAPIVLYPVTGEAPWRTIRSLVLEGGMAEAYQYLIGLLGALAAMEQRWAVILLAVPIVPLHWAFRSTKETQDSTRQVLEAMADAVDLRDPYTGGHSQRVARYTARILEGIGLHGPEVDLIVSAARVHDIGKIGTPDDVLLKDGRLSPEERMLMEQHPVHGAHLLTRYRDFHRGAAIVRSHHERWDGRGYPDGLKGGDIPFGARIVAVADSYDAMTSDRPYRQGMAPGRAFSILRDGSGSQWDSEIVEIFLRCMEAEPRLAEESVGAVNAVPATAKA